jgi:microcystin-dependent protein
MGTLNESPVWANTIYRMEETDPLHGGEPNENEGLGQLNWAPLQLANRTLYLKEQCETLAASQSNVDVNAIVQAAVNDLIDGAPGAMNTLNELATAIQSNDGAIGSALAQMANKMSGANNLSEITDPAQARANIGAASQADVANIDVSAQIQAAINSLVNGAPGALDTLNELATAIQSNDGEIDAALAQMANKMSGANNLSEVSDQAQARTNIGAAAQADVDNKMSGANNLSEITDQAQARANIGAGTGVPLGAIAAFHQTTPPAGWLVCDGTPVTNLFPELRAHLLAQPGAQTDGNGDPLLPDYRGEFLRGLDAGRGVDAGRVLGSAQSSAITVPRDGWTSTGQSPEDDLTAGRLVIVSGEAEASEYLESIDTADADNVSTGHPRNVAALICIKAFDEVQIAGMANLSALLAGIATQAQAEEGLNNTLLMTPLRVAQAIAALTPQQAPQQGGGLTTYLSLWTNLTSYSKTIFLHGLGQMPSGISVEMKCINSQGGYNVGEVIVFGGEANNAGGDYGFTTSLVGTTGVRVCIGNTIRQKMVVNSADFTLNFTKWQYRVRATV